MPSTLVITVNSDTMTQTDLQNKFKLDSNKSTKALAELATFLKSHKAVHASDIDVQTGSAAPVAASATLTLTSAIATDAITIGPTTLTASSTPANENEWEIDGATDADDAAALASAINDHSTLGQIVTATSASNVVTVTCKTKGVVGNAINISSADGTIVASAANLSGGTGGATDAATTYSKGA